MFEQKVFCDAFEVRRGRWFRRFVIFGPRRPVISDSSGSIYTHAIEVRMNNTFLDRATPKLRAIDPRGGVCREIGYCRSQANQVPERRITRFCCDLMGREITSWDPRLWAKVELGNTLAANLIRVRSLSGAELLTDSVDAGWRVTLFGSACREYHLWDSRSSEFQYSYDFLLRLIAVRASTKDEQEKIVERFFYGGTGEGEIFRNQGGRLVCHDDEAGTLRFTRYSLNGHLLEESRQFMASLDTSDWSSDLSLRDKLLADECFISTFRYFASGELRAKVDALGNTQNFDYTESGELRNVQLQTSGGDRKTCTLVSDMRYNAQGQIESEHLGCGANVVAEYDPENSRLSRLVVGRGFSRILQDLRYVYDPVGNILHIENAAQPISFYKNQKVERVSFYQYDSLYQLILAIGREIGSPMFGPQLPAWQKVPIDPNCLRSYTQSFEYDKSGNQRVRYHSNSPTVRMAVSEFGNRSLGQYEDGSLPAEQEIAQGFDANGNQHELTRGQRMSWNVRNQLQKVTLVKRESGSNDEERYYYDGTGRRVRKVHMTQVGDRIMLAQVFYLPGLEIHRCERREHHVVDIDLGRCRARIMQWAQDPPVGVTNDQITYCLKDHLGSSTLELDGCGGLSSQESYYPFGGTAWHSSRSEEASKYKAIRYSGKERDATGLYYYGFRYYATWLCRWISPDPSGTVYGQNLYAMVENRPTSLTDVDGLKPGIADAVSHSFQHTNLKARFDRLDQKSQAARRFIQEKFEPPDFDPESHLISSTYFHYEGGQRYESWFVNEFREEIWVFKENYKTTPPGNDNASAGRAVEFYANDVARYQYEIVANQLGFFGRLPSIIKRENVLNYKALANTVSSANEMEDLSAVFFTKTPNGKSTSRIIEDFDLEAVSVEKIKRSGGAIDFLIHVQPKSIQRAEPKEFTASPQRGSPDRDDVAARFEFFGFEPLKGSFRRGSIDMTHFDRYW
ncbi:RHS repeat-associated core domain-containing protein [Pseudomonas sp. 18173]|uniref:RHS repeat domain-containing protein n=1 Tax=Pseudomonas sp. 18173 TaxID=3390055 RepID=UPI003D1EDF2C